MKKIVLIFGMLLILSCSQTKSKHVANKLDQKVENSEDSVPYREILLSIFGTLSAYLIWRVQHQKDRIKDIENQLSQKKHELYSELVYIIIDLISGPKMGKIVSEKDILKRILNIKRDMFLYAPDNVFKKFTQWTLEISKPNPGVDHFKIYFELMNLARKDMGKSSSKISLDDFMLFLMQNEEEYKLFKETNNW